MSYDFTFEKIVKPYKSHRCEYEYCRQKIERNDRCWKIVGKYEGDFYSMYLHVYCKEKYYNEYDD